VIGIEVPAQLLARAGEAIEQGILLSCIDRSRKYNCQKGNEWALSPAASQP
jgi:hypothetical protein